MNDKTLRSIIRDENNKSNIRLKKDLKDVFITRKEYYNDQTGKPGTGKEAAKFWGKLAGLVTVLTTLVGLLISFLGAKLP